MRRLWTIVRKEFIHIIRDKRTLSIVILMPALLLLLLGVSVMNDIKDLEMAVVDFSKTDASRAFIQRYVSSGYFKISYEVQSETELIDLMNQDMIKAGLLIPEDFGRKLDTGQQTDVQVYLNTAAKADSQTAQFALETVSQAAAQDIFIEKMSSLTWNQNFKAPVTIHTRYLYNPDMRSLNYMIPNLTAVILQLQALLLTAFSVVREREQGTMEQLIVTPVKTWELMLGKILPYMLVAFINVLVVLAIGVFVFNVPILGNIWLLLLLSMIFILGSLGLGVLISNISRTQIQAMYLASGIILMPSFILSGMLLSRHNMPWIARAIGDLLPVTHYLTIVNGIYLKGVDATFLWPSIWPLLALSVVFFTASVIFFKKRIG